MSGPRLRFPYKWCRSKLGSAFFILLCMGAVVLVINYFEGFVTLSHKHRETAKHLPYEMAQGAGAQDPAKASHKLSKWGVKMVQVCKPPTLSLAKDTIHGAYKKLKPLKCKGQPLFSLDHQTIKLNNAALNKSNKIQNCVYQSIKREVTNDDSFYLVNITTRTSNDKAGYHIKVPHEFVKITCSFTNRKKNSGDINHKVRSRRHILADAVIQNIPLNFYSKRKLLSSNKKAEVKTSGKPVHRKKKKKTTGKKKKHTKKSALLGSTDQFIAQVVPTNEIFNRVIKYVKERPPTALNVNILIIGIDSLSQLAFQRKLPKTYKYITNDLKGVVMSGYSVVGETTTSAFLPLLTGQSESEMPDVKRSHQDPEHIDKYPFLWYKYENHGYVTMLAEDEPHIGMFNTELTGFRDEPTDHYMRPFWQAVSKSDAGNEKHCLNGRPRHQIIFDYVKDFLRHYRNVSKFSVVHLQELSKEDSNRIQYLDQDLEKFLMHLDDTYMRNTLLVIVSDHGGRSSKISLKTLGKMEERLPFLSFVFPRKLQQKYPRLMLNLKNNVHRLTTPFDVHETLSDFLDFSRTKKPIVFSERGISLLKPIPLNRTCESAGVSTHWCPCLVWKPVSVKDSWVALAANKILAVINGATLKYSDKCERLSIKNVVEARIMVPNEKAYKYVEAMLSDDDNADFTGTSRIDFMHYLITMTTSPNNAKYEATVMMNLEEQTMTVMPDIIRLDKTLFIPVCLKSLSLGKFCHCSVTKN